MRSVYSRHRVFFIVFGLILSSQAAAAEWTLTSWQSTGDTHWAHNASELNPYLGNPTSELHYENVDSKVIEMSLSIPVNSNSMRFVIGSGTIDSGLLVDDDYVSAAGATYYGATVSGAHRISRTHSDVRDSGLFYLSAEFYPSALSFDLGGIPLQLYGGFQYWHEKYSAQGVRQIECTDSTGPPTFCNPVGYVGYTNQTVITNNLTWATAYIGLRSQLELSQNMSLGLRLNYSPSTYLSNEDIHHLRTDLRQDPSFSMTGFGQAIDVQLNWQYRFMEQAEFSIGYRYWDRKVTSGDWYAYSTSGSSSAPLLEMQTTRKGLTLGLNVVF